MLPGLLSLLGQEGFLAFVIQLAGEPGSLRTLRVDDGSESGPLKSGQLYLHTVMPALAPQPIFVYPGWIML